MRKKYVAAAVLCAAAAVLAIWALRPKLSLPLPGLPGEEKPVPEEQPPAGVEWFVVYSFEADVSTPFWMAFPAPYTYEHYITTENEVWAIRTPCVYTSTEAMYNSQPIDTTITLEVEYGGWLRVDFPNGIQGCVRVKGTVIPISAGVPTLNQCTEEYKEATGDNVPHTFIFLNPIAERSNVRVKGYCALYKWNGKWNLVEEYENTATIEFRLRSFRLNATSW